MAELTEWLRLVAYALGTLGAALLFLEFFQDPNYVTYKKSQDRYRLEMMPETVQEYTNLGRIGAFCLAVAFAMLFLADILG